MCKSVKEPFWLFSDVHFIQASRLVDIFRYVRVRRMVLQRSKAQNVIPAKMGTIALAKLNRKLRSPYAGRKSAKAYIELKVFQ